jgi:hypothetical protein
MYQIATTRSSEPFRRMGLRRENPQTNARRRVATAAQAMQRHGGRIQAQFST